MTRGPAAAFQRAAVVSALVTVGFPLDDESTVNSQGELAVATSGSHNLFGAQEIAWGWCLNPSPPAWAEIGRPFGAQTSRRLDRSIRKSTMSLVVPA